MSDSWASTDDHAPQAASAASSGNSNGWQSTDDHAPAAGFTGNTQGDSGAGKQIPDAWGQFGWNVLKSSGRFAADLAGPLLHPVNTVEGLTGLFEGMSEKSGNAPVNGQSHQQYVDALAKMYSDRYGGWENFKKTLYEDPVGVLSDIATVAGVGGAAAKGVETAADAAKLGTLGDVAGNVAKGASTVEKVTNPLNIAGKVADVTGATNAVGNFADWAAQKLTKGSLRGGYTVNTDPAKVEAAATAMRQGNIPFSEKGLSDINASLGDLQQNKLKLVGSAPLKVDPANVELSLDEVANKRQWQVNPNTDMKQIEQVRQNFRQQTGGAPITVTSPTGKVKITGYQQGPPMPATEAEALKEGTYANNKYGGDVPPQVAATAEAEKALARGLRGELERQFPELRSFNEQQSKFIDLDAILQAAVRKYTNSGGFMGSLVKNTVGDWKAAGKTTAIILGGSALHEPAAAGAAALMSAVLSDPAVKARLARGLDWVRQTNPGRYGNPAGNGLTRINEYTSQFQPQQ